MTSTELIAFAQIVLIDMSMAADNAIAVGLAASGLPKDKRHHAVLAGIGAATILRILFALFAVQMLRITGLLVAGGLLLLWVTWKMYHEVRHIHAQKNAPESELENKTAVPKKLSSAIWQIIAADVSMSLDNVLAVAGVARDHVWVLVAGLALSVVLMGAAATYVAKLTHRFPWIGYVGVLLIFYTSINMIWDGSHELYKNVIVPN